MISVFKVVPAIGAALQHRAPAGKRENAMLVTAAQGVEPFDREIGFT